MLCKKTDCPGEMKYFKLYEAEGYRCPLCGFTTRILAQEIADLNEDTTGFKDFITYDENGCMCIDDGALEAYLIATSPRPTT